MPDLTPADETPIANVVSGPVSGSTVQAGIVHGGIHQHHYADSRSVRLPFRAGRVPLRADQFQQRAIAADLARTLSSSQVAVLTSDSPTTRATVLAGLGGVGKTQLAADHVENAWAAGQLDLLVWINAATRDNIVAEYAHLATQLADANDTDPDTAAGRFTDWLAGTPARWLVVLDDLQVPADLTGLWPPECANGRTIVTTRRRDSALQGRTRRIIEVDLFTPAESVAYLSAKLQDHLRLAAGLNEMAQALGHLPLALCQAVAYMLDRELSCAE
jgi:hypothetical protein